MTAATNRSMIACVALAATLLGAAGCSGEPPPSPTARAAAEPGRTPAADRPPATLRQVGYAANDLFDAAWWSDWRRADLGLQSLNEAASELPLDLPRTDLVAKLRENVEGVTNGTNQRERIGAMACANAITQIVAELSAHYEPAVSYNVKMLGYYGRQIELGIASGRPTDAARAASDLATVWDRIEPEVVRRGHAVEAERFTDLVAQLIGAERPHDFVAPVSAELAAVPRLERIFTAPQ